MEGSIVNYGYRHTLIRHCDRSISFYYLRFIYECNNGQIPDGLVVDHIDNNKLNNMIENLKIITNSANLKKNYQPRSNKSKVVRSFCLNNNEILDLNQCF